MNRDFPEELLSAYLDGRATADESLRVQQALAESAELRQLHADLQRVQAELRQLPRFSLPPDFADRVVQEIERASRDRLAAMPATRPPANLSRPTAGRRRTWKGLAVAAASLAALLLLSVLWLSRRDLPSEPGGSVPEVASSRPVPQPSVPLARTDGALPDDRHPIAGNNAFQAAGPTYVFIVDLAITPEGQRLQVFQQSLQAAGIQFNSEVAIDEVLEKALLASRFIGDVEIVDSKGIPDKMPARDEIEMYYVTGLGDQIEAALADLRARPKDQVARQRFDLAIEPAERALFDQLNSAVRLADSRKGRTAPQAYRLALRFALRSDSAGLLGALSRPLVAAETPPAEQPAAVAAATAQKAASTLALQPTPEAPHTAAPHAAAPHAAADPMIPGGLADPNDDESTLYEVLFILRNLR